MLAVDSLFVASILMCLIYWEFLLWESVEFYWGFSVCVTSICGFCLHTVIIKVLIMSYIDISWCYLCSYIFSRLLRLLIVYSLNRCWTFVDLFLNMHIYYFLIMNKLHTRLSGLMLGGISSLNYLLSKINGCLKYSWLENTVNMILFKKVISLLTQLQTSGPTDSLNLLVEDNVVIRRVSSRTLIQDLLKEKIWKSNAR